MAFRKPIIASRVGGVPELVSDGEAGLLVPPASIAAIEHAVLTLLGDPQLARQIGEAGKRRAAHYGAQAMVDSLAKLYCELIPGNPPGVCRQA